MSEERFLSVLKEAKDLFLEKLQVAEQLRGENERLLEDVKRLKAKNEEVLLENKRLSEKYEKAKKFVKIYFADQLIRMKEIEKNGIYNAETFSYLVGDIARSVSETTLLAEIENDEMNKKPLHGKLSLNKENKRTRYEDVKPSKDHTNNSTSSNISITNTLTTKNTEEKKRDVLVSQKQNKNDETLDPRKTTFSKEHDLGGQMGLKNQSGKIKSYNILDIQTVLDASSSTPVSIGSPAKTSTQIKSVENIFDNTTQFIFPSQENEKFLRKSSSKSGTTDNSNLDPNLTLRLPLSPPSKCSTPQDLRFEEEPKKSPLAFSPTQTSPSILGGEDGEGLGGTFFSQIPLMEGEVPEQTVPQSPTIHTRSHSVTRTAILAATSPSPEQKKRKRSDISFGSILTSESLGSKQEVNESSASGERRLSSKSENRKKPSDLSSSKNKTPSPDFIFLDDSGFLKPSSTEIPRKKPKIISVTKESSLDKSSLLFASPQTSVSPGTKVMCFFSSDKH
ncbi:uncharacterized protein LOC114528523 [Dendronephthya gigantea]|uniref:uncharacterized protein LOC114528523 n=1 Tax=Dendronephthya gigantea TaxID=151771 RepID=UPI00106CC748|nr:uncharacterized protein LOC114528523 [Dendronephthya gigantea]